MIIFPAGAERRAHEITCLRNGDPSSAGSRPGQPPTNSNWGSSGSASRGPLVGIPRSTPVRYTHWTTFAVRATAIDIVFDYRVVSTACCEGVIGRENSCLLASSRHVSFDEAASVRQKTVSRCSGYRHAVSGRTYLCRSDTKTGPFPCHVETAPSRSCRSGNAPQSSSKGRLRTPAQVPAWAWRRWNSPRARPCRRRRPPGCW